MDGYYQAQVQMPYFRGTARQRGRGLGSLAFAIGRTALPIMKKYVFTAAKRIGKSIIENAVPELIEVASGRAKPKEALKRAAKKTVKAQLGSGRVVKKQTQCKKSVKRRRTTKNSRSDIFKNIQ